MTVASRLKSVKARDMMTKFAITATVDQSIFDLANLFIRFKISGVPVVDDDEQIIGIVTAADLFNHMQRILEVVDQGLDPRQACALSIKEIMSPSVTSISEEMSLYDMIRLMYEKDIHTLPVVRGSKLVGVIGRRDLIHGCYETVGCTHFNP